MVCMCKFLFPISYLNFVHFVSLGKYQYLWLLWVLCWCLFKGFNPDLI